MEKVNPLKLLTKFVSKNSEKENCAGLLSMLGNV
jgi:hypothetical protein